MSVNSTHEQAFSDYQRVLKSLSSGDPMTSVMQAYTAIIWHGLQIKLWDPSTVLVPTDWALSAGCLVTEAYQLVWGLG